MNGKQLSVKLDRKQSLYLERLARESGRSQGQVIQRLIIHAVNDPGSLRALGAWDYLADKPKNVTAEEKGD